MRIALLAVMLDEADYLPRWMNSLQQFRDIFTETVIIDGGSRDASSIILRGSWVRVVSRRFEGDFSAQRNFGIDQCQADWVLELDADEIAATALLHGLHEIARGADQHEVDCIGIPRLNFIDDRLVAGPGTRGLDFQYRLHRQHCRWQRPVHEEIVGWRNCIELKVEHGHFLIHDKTSARHEARNAYYRSIGG